MQPKTSPFPGGNRICSLFTMSITTQRHGDNPGGLQPIGHDDRSTLRNFDNGRTSVGDAPYKLPNNGGARRDRTDDLMLAKHALSQLSYGPARAHQEAQPAGQDHRRMVGLGRLELPTSRLSSARSNQLSYKPEPRAGDRSRRAGRTRPTSPRDGLVRGRKRNEGGEVPHNGSDKDPCSEEPHEP